MFDPGQVPEVFTEAFHSRSQPDWDKGFEHYDATVSRPGAAFWKEFLFKYPDANVIQKNGIILLSEPFSNGHLAMMLSCRII